MRSQDLRHRIDIESEQTTKNADGDIVPEWLPWADDVPAAWRPGPGREYLASEATRAEVEGRFTIRYMPGITAAMRVRWEGRIWEIKAPPLVDETARREITLMVGSIASG